MPENRGIPTPRILPAGDRSLLLAPGDRDDLAALVDLLRHESPSGVGDVLPAAQTVLVTMTETADRGAVEQRLRDLLRTVRASGAPAPAPGGSARANEVTIPVRYDGPDLDTVAALLGVGAREVIDRHTRAVWRCAFIGFAPGFGYLQTPDNPLAVPRRSAPRTAVPAGAVALADGYSAVYPRHSPGGWQLIGSTDIRLWDLDRTEPSLLRPGTRVRFTEAGAA